MSGQRGKGRQDARRPAAPPAKPKKSVRPAQRVTPTEEPLPPGPLRLGTIPGATPGKWVDTWQERMPRTRLELVPISVADQADALHRGEVDVAILRLPIDADGLHVIPLYEEQPVVVCARDSHLTAADELTASDLDGEVLVTPLDDVLAFTTDGVIAPRFAPPETTEDAVAVVASGVGIAVMPMSLARLHARKDVDVRRLVDGPTSRVALAWDADRTDPLIDTFVGIVRGRSARSSRG